MEKSTYSPPQRDRLDGEEVDREHALRLLPQEGPPGEPGALTTGADAGLAQDLPAPSSPTLSGRDR
jgi:hypothetical protein